MLKEGERKSENPLSKREIELCQTFPQRKLCLHASSMDL